MDDIKKRKVLSIHTTYSIKKGFKFLTIIYKKVLKTICYKVKSKEGRAPPFFLVDQKGRQSKGFWPNNLMPCAISNAFILLVCVFIFAFRVQHAMSVRDILFG